jgi:hypothetical protein
VNTILAMDQPPDSAASSRGGDIGSSVIRVPVAIAIALAMAAIGGQMFTSPTYAD